MYFECSDASTKLIKDNFKIDDKYWIEGAFFVKELTPSDLVKYWNDKAAKD